MACCLHNLASVYRTQGKFEKAESLFRQALAIVEKLFGPDHPSVPTSLNQLGDLHVSVGDYAEAETLVKRSLAIAAKRE